MSKQTLSSSSVRKRPREDDDRFAMVLSFDDPFRPVRVDKRLLQQYDCRLAKIIERDAPNCEVDGLPAWNVDIGRSMLVAMMKCLTHHEFIVPKDVTYHEAVRVLEYEGIGVPMGNLDTQSESRIDGAPMGVGMRKQEESAADVLMHTCTLITNAIIEWPRLDYGLEEGKSGNEAGFTCTSTRCWVAFAPRPPIQRYGGDEMYMLAKKRPFWLWSTLAAIGYVHWRLWKQGKLDATARDEKAFVTLARNGIELDSAHFFLSTKRDMPRTLRDSYRPMVQYADKFAAQQTSAVVEFGAISGTAPVLPTNVKYARACISLAEKLVRETPNCQTLFSGACCDETTNGGKNAEIASSQERKALEKALRVHGIRVLQWKNERPSDVTPLVFPPSFRSTLTGADQLCALLTFEGVSR